MGQRTGEVPKAQRSVHRLTPNTGHWKGGKSEVGRQQGKLLFKDIRRKHLLRKDTAIDQGW